MRLNDDERDLAVEPRGWGVYTPEAKGYTPPSPRGIHPQGEGVYTPEAKGYTPPKPRGMNPLKRILLASSTLLRSAAL